MVGGYDFYQYSYIMKQITASKFREPMKAKMICILQYFCKHSYQNLLHDLNMTQAEWKYILDKFNQIQCSPIPVPTRYSRTIYPGISNWEQFF